MAAAEVVVVAVVVAAAAATAVGSVVAEYVADPATLLASHSEGLLLSAVASAPLVAPTAEPAAEVVEVEAVKQYFTHFLDSK